MLNFKEIRKQVYPFKPHWLYAYNASKAQYSNSRGELKDGMDSKAIKKQLSRYFDFLIGTLQAKNIQRYTWKVKGVQNSITNSLQLLSLR